MNHKNWLIYMLPVICGVVMICHVVQTAAKDLECRSIRHPDGSASYYLQGGKGTQNCSIEWSSNNTVLAHEGGKDDIVLNRSKDHLTIQTCKDTVHYKEDCPDFGVVQEVDCFCNCTQALQKVDNRAIDSGGSVQIPTGVILVLPFVIIIIIIIIITAVLIFNWRTIIRCFQGRSPLPLQDEKP